MDDNSTPLGVFYGACTFFAAGISPTTSPGRACSNGSVERARENRMTWWFATMGNELQTKTRCDAFDDLYFSHLVP